jgi:hypothetical protein
VLKQSRDSLAADCKVSFPASLHAFLEKIWKASDARSAGGSAESYCESVMTAFSNLVMMLCLPRRCRPFEFDGEAPL